MFIIYILALVETDFFRLSGTDTPYGPYCPYQTADIRSVIFHNVLTQELSVWHFPHNTGSAPSPSFLTSQNHTFFIIVEKLSLPHPTPS